MAVAFVNYGGSRTAPGGLKHFYDRSVTPRNTPNQNEPILDKQTGVAIDYDLLVSNVENMLLADKSKLIRRDMRPKDLLVKSNPGLFGNMHPDITNPRDMYNFLSKRKFPTIADDELSMSRQKTFDEKLSRSNSFRDLNKNSASKMQKKYHFYSHQDLSLMEKKDPSLVALNNNAPYVGPDEMAKIPEREKTVISNFNLPSLHEETSGVGKDDFTEAVNNSVSLPGIHSAPADTFAKSMKSEERSKKAKTTGSKRSNVTFDNKIDKWFSEMPSEITDKADRAIMEDIIRGRMATYQTELRSNDAFAKMKRRNNNIKSLNQIQHQYLELRAETAPRPYRHDLNHYKMKQKSSLNLKSDLAEVDKKDKRNTSPDFRSSNKESDIYNDENKTPIKDLAKPRQQGLNGLKKINLDQFAVDAYKLNPNRRFTFAQLQSVRNKKTLEDIDDDAVRRKSDREHWFRMNQTKAHPSIVNISIENERRGIPKASNLKQTLSVVKMDTAKEPDNCLLIQNDDLDNTTSTVNIHRQKPHASKTALSKFNTLEVFGGSRSTQPENQGLIQSVNPLVKLDLRHSRSRMKQTKDLPSTLLPKQPQEMTTLDFQFGTGEVIITRKSNGESLDSADKVLIHSPNAPPENSENLSNQTNIMEEYQKLANVIGETQSDIFDENKGNGQQTFDNFAHNGIQEGEHLKEQITSDRNNSKEEP